jgi:hypothetical protein
LLVLGATSVHVRLSTLALHLCACTCTPARPHTHLGPRPHSHRTSTHTHALALAHLHTPPLPACTFPVPSGGTHTFVSHVRIRAGGVRSGHRGGTLSWQHNVIKCDEHAGMQKKPSWVRETGDEGGATESGRRRGCLMLPSLRVS